ncbi:GntR family transcriptional regulator [Herbiconiux moechotypicola]|uniref:HTH gntR-type domain-containing protein n=1 Tax=Herbiconiux moechotypicola TaxID=637393 RepID=A0ABN3DER7_9MICO|nr:GntR family transcriptional regulator [Herbiconiux moechotypicola]MCS5729326.1 GntR family transcriptional regulator [Herbiconiux moechotypicola]
MSDEQPLRVRPVRDRRPLSVQVYDRLVEALRLNGQPGDTIPPEIELSADLGVSRTVLREALRLLEEDGVIERGADPRRRQLARPSSKPPAFNAPLEEMLQASGPLTVDVVRTERLSVTNWSRVLLDLPEGDGELLCRESLFLLDSEPVASAIEFVPTGDPGIPVHLVGRESDRQQTMLAAFGAQFRSKCAPSLWRFGAGGSSRSRTGFNLVPRGHLTSLTSVLSKGGKPVFLAKYLIRLDAVVLAVGDDPEGADALTLDSL